MHNQNPAMNSDFVPHGWRHCILETMRMHGKAWGALLVCVAACLTACSTPSSSTTLPSGTAQAVATPIDGMPTDHTLAGVNMHNPADTWVFIATTTGNPIAVRINTIWQGSTGELSNRSYTQGPGEQSVDTSLAIPYYLSWSYVVFDGTADDEPTPILLPSDTGNLFDAESPFADHDCPDYSPNTATGPGFLVTHCVVSLSQDGAYPIGVAFAVPDQTQQYWFLDAPEPIWTYPPPDTTTATTTPSQKPT